MTTGIVALLALSVAPLLVLAGMLWEHGRAGGTFDQARAARRLRAHLSILQAEARATDPMWADFLRTQR